MSERTPTDNAMKSVAAPVPQTTLVFRAVLPDGKTISVFSDGATEGLPDGTVVANYFVPAYQGARAGDGKTLTLPPGLPASFPGAAEHLAWRLGQLVEKCRPGYVVSKTVRAQLEECEAVASAFAFAASQAPCHCPGSQA